MHLREERVRLRGRKDLVHPSSHQRRALRRQQRLVVREDGAVPTVLVEHEAEPRQRIRDRTQSLLAQTRARLQRPHR